MLSYFSLALITVFLAWIAKANDGNLTTVNGYITAFANLMVLLTIAAHILLICLNLNNKHYTTMDNVCSHFVSLTIKSFLVASLVDGVRTMSNTNITHVTTILVIGVVCLCIANFVFGAAKSVLARLLIEDCIDLDYIKLKDYKVTDNFIAEEYKTIPVDSQELSITKDASGDIKLAKGQVTFIVAKMLVKLEFAISPYMSGTLVTDETQIRFKTVEAPLGMAKQVKKTIKF